MEKKLEEHQKELEKVSYWKCMSSKKHNARNKRRRPLTDCSNIFSLRKNLFHSLLFSNLNSRWRTTVFE